MLSERSQTQTHAQGRIQFKKVDNIYTGRRQNSADCQEYSAWKRAFGLLAVLFLDLGTGYMCVYLH